MEDQFSFNLHENSSLSKNISITESLTRLNGEKYCTNKIRKKLYDFIKSPSYKILKCRERFRKRKQYYKLLESTILHDSDDRPFVKVEIFNDSIVGLLDSGANVSVLGVNCLEFLERNNISYSPIKSSLSVANGSRQNILGFCKIPIHFKGVTKEILFYLVPSLNQQAYFGTNFWKEFALAPDIIPTVSSLQDISTSAHSKSATKFHDLTAEQKLVLEKVILQFPSYEKQGLGCTDLLEHNIDTGDAVPIKCRYYPLSPPRQEEAYKEIDHTLL